MGILARLMGREERASAALDSPFTDGIVEVLLQRAGGAGAKITATGALQAAARMVGHAFAAAEVVGPPLVQDAFCPSNRALLGRSLVRYGEIIFAVDTGLGALRLHPAATYDISGSYSPESWLYRVQLAGPSSQTVRQNVPASEVLHFTWERDSDRPWKGNSPVASASLAGRLSAEVLAGMGDEATQARGSLLPIPVDGADPTVGDLKGDIRKLKGGTAVVESQVTGSWSEGGARSASADWTPRRLGFNPPKPLIDLHSVASREVLGACGVPAALFDPATSATASREAWRQFLFGTIAPLGKMVSVEMSGKMGVPISLEWQELRASDLQGRARAFGSMVQGGMSVESAASLAGLEGAVTAPIESEVG